jgi:hypothetical protein
LELVEGEFGIAATIAAFCMAALRRDITPVIVRRK